jgi:hypothetical protein
LVAERIQPNYELQPAWRPKPSSQPLPFTQHGFRGRIGVAREDITPPLGIYARNWGAARHDVAIGIHRPLTATALTIQRDANSPPLVVVSLDLGWWRSYRDELYVRDFLLESLNLGAERLMLSFTHTHSGPSICQEDRDKPGGHLISPYLDQLRSTTLRAVNAAMASAVPAVLEWRKGTCGLAQNRDLRDPDLPRYLCGANPDEAADDLLLVGRVTADDGRIAATLVNYACHPTTLAWQNELISPDFVGAMRELVEANTAEAPCLFLQGAGGELAPREQYSGDPQLADRNGRELGYSVLSTLTGMFPRCRQLGFSGSVESGASLATWEQESCAYSSDVDARHIDVSLQLKAMPTAAALISETESNHDRVEVERIVRKRRIREGVGDGSTTLMPAWIWRIGECVFVGHPNEAYSQLQTVLRARFEGLSVVVMNVVNGHYGYLPPKHLYGQDLYPVWQTPFDQGSLERLIDECTEAIQDLTNSET